MLGRGSVEQTAAVITATRKGEGPISEKENEAKLLILLNGPEIITENDV